MQWWNSSTRQREGELKTSVFSFNAKDLKNANKICKIDNINYKKDVLNKNASLGANHKKNILVEKVYNEKNKRIDCLAKVKSRVMQSMSMQVKHNNNAYIKLLQNRLSFLRVKDKYA